MSGTLIRGWLLVVLVGLGDAPAHLVFAIATAAYILVAVQSRNETRFDFMEIMPSSAAECH